MTSEAQYKASKETQGKRIKILKHKQMLQILPIVLPKINVGNTTDNLLNEIRKNCLFIASSKKITKNYIIT